jgi:hypothetical protein
MRCESNGGLRRFAPTPPYELMALLTGWFASVVFRKD